MKEASKVLFVSQEVMPYLPESPMSKISRELPQKVQEDGREMRAFMPRYGCVNERRNQLHEVIRLSGMNLIIDDTDHPLIIKVASIQAARMQVYFIDNEDYFQRKSIYKDADGKEFDDNDERVIFFSRGVIETVKKLRWTPNVVHLHGWMGALVALYLKKAFYVDDPYFKNVKIVLSLYDEHFDNVFPDNFESLLQLDGLKEEDTAILRNGKIDYNSLMKLTVENSDGVIYAGNNVQAELKEYASSKGIPALDCPIGTEDYAERYMEFYDSLFD
ncbi:MAG: glycogen/starch synthase [Paludibacteraceae bacterium]|nr:glycogen/starch synthase [Paludibacteraceae bacterium]